MKPCFASLPAVTLSLGLLTGVACLAADSQPLPAQPGGKLPGNVAIQLVKVADGLVDPIHVASPKDGTGRLFVCERPGVIRIIKDGKVLSKPFLDIKDKTLSSFLEEGLYAVEFHPKLKENGLQEPQRWHSLEYNPSDFSPSHPRSDNES